MSEFIIECEYDFDDGWIPGEHREEIVRCRDCKRYIPQGTYRFNGGVVNKDTCNVIRGFVVQIDPDGFCAWGERRGRMSEIKALDRLREKVRLDVNNPWSDLKGDLLVMCDKVEREIAERYIELPLAADGVPIHIGDKMQYHGGDPFTVCAVAPGVIHTWAAVKLGERKTTYDYAPIQCTHYKPRTLEDVLQCAGVSVAAIEDVAAEIRELMGDAE